MCLMRKDVVLHAPVATGIHEGVLLRPGLVRVVPRHLVSSTRVRSSKGPFNPESGFHAAKWGS
ncbi:hypothetical protein E2C01_024777 [Portunus trituberculatus]|uniref:Uncharacterized protein n=1 Tax=Portunus trituberculatus TaxID=210409 RepID=A0A5B7EDU2_PORTR|nr:hypothetical protein [Portunus trituberculatus]